MSDPRIYHRVGPVAPEGRQIYDDMRRSILTQTSNFDTELSGLNTLLTGEITALNTTLSGEIILIESNINDIEIAATDLDTQVNALTITPVQVGTGTGFALQSPVTNTGDGTTVSEIEVTPVVANPFFLDILGGLLLEASTQANNFYANIYEKNLPFATYTWLQNLYVGTEATPVPVEDQGWLPVTGQGGAPIGMGAHILIPNTSTDTREFKLAVRGEFSSGIRIAQHTGSFNAFQWTVA